METIDNVYLSQCLIVVGMYRNHVYISVFKTIGVNVVQTYMIVSCLLHCFAESIHVLPQNIKGPST